MPLEPHTLLDHYEVLAPLGAGGMGEVYRARDARLNREVAIKVLPKSYSADPERLRRFEQEARAAAALNHPNILSVYHLGSLNGVPYIVSELLEGETLREKLSHGPLSFRRAVNVGAQIARGLAAAHEKGIVHRDLKPENLFLTRDGLAKILDFGLARMTQTGGMGSGSNGPHADQTLPGMVLGTVGYMAPEQVRGQTSDPRSDIFAFSAILYEMLTGRRAFQRPTSPEIMTAILHEDPEPLAQLAPATPFALQRVVQRGLEKDPEQRFQSASDMAFALEALSDSTGLTHSMPALKEHGPATRRVAAWASLAAVLLAGAVAAYLWMQPSPVPQVGNYVQLTHDGLQKTLIGTDGARLYMTLINSGQEDVATIPLQGGQITNLPMPGQNMIPLNVTSDGVRFLLVAGQGFPQVGPLWSLPVLGGSPRRLGDTVGDSAAWSPDGKTLAFANGGDLYLADADGGNPRKLLTVKQVINDLDWSPDGQHLSFDTSDFAQTGNAGTGVGNQSLWEVAANGSDLRPMLGKWHPAADQCCGAWTADGKYFLFQSQGQIWALPTKQRIFHGAAAPIQLTSSPMSLHSPVPSLDGKQIFVVGRTYRGELNRFDSKQKAFLPYLNGISAEWLDFSKDGKWVVYVTYPEGSMWKSRTDGSDRTQLTFAPFRPVLPRWSPDGKTIAFFEFPGGREKPGHMFTIPADGGTPQALMPRDPNNEQDANWSPDGSKLVFAGDANDAAVAYAGQDVRILDLKSRQVTTVPGSEGLYSPRWSPDGSHMVAMTGDSARVMLYDFQTQKWTELTSGTFGWLNFSHDGQYIYMKDFAGKGSVVRVNIHDHKLEQVVDLTDFTDTGQGGGSLALTPDDATLMLRDTGTQDVYALDWKQR
ncbi:MAG TPA: protein kinase [Terracidiphilus sp.]|nr:protein kinase [Terracidiphilus sp.]